MNPDHLDVQFDFGGLPVNWTHKSWGFTSIYPYLVKSEIKYHLV